MLENGLLRIGGRLAKAATPEERKASCYSVQGPGYFPTYLEGYTTAIGPCRKKWIKPKISLMVGDIVVIMDRIAPLISCWEERSKPILIKVDLFIARA